jgi:bifunctional DNase/RNase
MKKARRPSAFGPRPSVIFKGVNAMNHVLKKVICCASLLLAISLTGPPSSTRADKNKSHLIDVSLATILDAGSDGAVLILKENKGDHLLPIHVGDLETRAILFGLQKLRGKSGSLSLVPERPLTHNLMLNAIGKLGARIESITVTDLRNDTFYADILIKEHDGKELIIDARPSDAIALVVTMDKPVPIYVTKELMNKAGKLGPNLFDHEDKGKNKPVKL